MNFLYNATFLFIASFRVVFLIRNFVTFNFLLYFIIVIFYILHYSANDGALKSWGHQQKTLFREKLFIH